jgi:hypothetical protein
MSYPGVALPHGLCPSSLITALSWQETPKNFLEIISNIQ